MEFIALWMWNLLNGWYLQYSGAKNHKWQVADVQFVCWKIHLIVRSVTGGGVHVLKHAVESPLSIFQPVEYNNTITALLSVETLLLVCFSSLLLQIYKCVSGYIYHTDLYNKCLINFFSVLWFLDSFCLKLKLMNYWRPSYLR